MMKAIAFACLAVGCVSGPTLFAQSAAKELKPIAFSTLDTNKDGKISVSEARADPDLYASFDMLDLNHDGFLSPAEFQAWPRAAKATAASAPDPATVPGGSAGAQHMPAN